MQSVDKQDTGPQTALQCLRLHRHDDKCRFDGSCCSYRSHTSAAPDETSIAAHDRVKFLENVYGPCRIAGPVGDPNLTSNSGCQQKDSSNQLRDAEKTDPGVCEIEAGQAEMSRLAVVAGIAGSRRRLPGCPTAGATDNFNS